MESIGDLLIAIGIVLNSISYAPAQRLARAVGPTTASGFPSLVAGFILLPFALIISPEALTWNATTAHGWVYLLITVILFYAISLLAWFYSLRGLDAWMSSALRCIGPVVAAPVAWIFFGQELSLIQSFGAAVVLLTSFMMVFERSKK
jgi:drug/metabolite transporter (DMT)-like permease